MPAAKSQKVAERPRVTLRRGRGSASSCGPGGEYWHIFVGDRRAGRVFIAADGGEASIQIFVNEGLRGRGIGAAALRLACRKSAHRAIHAHLRRSNVASRRALERAGFAPTRGAGRQLTLVYRK